MTHAVLLVDDDIEILEMFQKLLRREPYEINLAPSAEEAFTVLAENKISVVVSDERMPGMNGTEFLARVQLEYPDVMRIMVTGHSSVDVAMRAINEGQVYRFLLKPVRASELGSAIRDALTEWDLRHASEASLDREQRREAALAELESQWQGLTQIERDDSGAIVVPEASPDLENALREAESLARQRGRR